MARIMPADEVKAVPSMTMCWFEFATPMMGEELLELYMLKARKREASMKQYGKTWRVWDGKPGEDERKAIMWEK